MEPVIRAAELRPSSTQFRLDDQQLPSFGKPPVVEVALGLQFTPITALRAAHFGVLWKEFFPELDLTDDQAPVDPQFETFDTRPRPRISFEVLDKPPLPRCWFFNNQKTELVQIQNNRFVQNWRKIEANNVYPRYPYIRTQFGEKLTRFERFLETVGLPKIEPNQCEITYVNHIPRSGDTELASYVFTSWADALAEDQRMSLEDVGFRLRFLIRGETTEQPIGRLHASVEPVVRNETGEALWAFTLVVRGTPTTNDKDGITNFFDEGRRHIVRSFFNLTTEQMHERWEFQS